MSEFLGNAYKKIFYLHVLLPFIVAIVFESMVGRRVGFLTYALVVVYMSISIFRLWKQRSSAESPKQKSLFFVMSFVLLLPMLLQLLSFG